MSRDEIRHWLRELHTTYGWPWETLARTLGLGEGKHAVSKVRGGEQRRCSRQLDRIISGELVSEKRGQRVDAVLADNLTPLTTRSRMAYDLKAGRIFWVAPRLAPEPVLPSFRNALTRFAKGVEN